MDTTTYLAQNIVWILPLIIIDLIIKSFALWEAARNRQLYWFIAIAVFNTAGILPAIYLLFFQCDCNKERAE